MKKRFLLCSLLSLIPPPSLNAQLTRITPKGTILPGYEQLVQNRHLHYQHRGVIEHVATAGTQRKSASSSLLKQGDSAQRTIKVWDSSTQECIFVVHETVPSMLGASHIALSHDGTYLAALYGDSPSGPLSSTITIWNTETGDIQSRLQAGSTITALTITPDGQTVMAGLDNGTVAAWETSTGRQLYLLSPRKTAGPAGAITHVATTASGHVAVAAHENNMISMFPVRDNAQAWRTLPIHTPITSLSMISSNTDALDCVAGFQDGSLMVWHNITQQNYTTTSLVSDHGSAILTVQSDTTGGFHSINTRGSLHTWSNNGGILRGNKREQLAMHIDRNDRPFKAAAIAPDGNRIITGSDRGTVRIDLPGAQIPQEKQSPNEHLK
jgi:WD40 repeat protein